MSEEPKFCHQCKDFWQDGIADQYDKHGQPQASLCLYYREYAAEDDEACELFEEA